MSGGPAGHVRRARGHAARGLGKHGCVARAALPGVLRVCAAAFRADPNYCVLVKGMVRTPLDFACDGRLESTAVMLHLREQYDMRFAHEVAPLVRG